MGNGALPHRPSYRAHPQVSAPEQAGVLRLLPIALIGGILESLSLSSFLNNPKNSILFGLREIYISIVVRDVDDDVERVGHVSPLSRHIQTLYNVREGVQPLLM
jgi:hypothetical protein